MCSDMSNAKDSPYLLIFREPPQLNHKCIVLQAHAIDRCIRPVEVCLYSRATLTLMSPPECMCSCVLLLRSCYLLHLIPHTPKISFFPASIHVDVYWPFKALQRMM